MPAACKGGIRWTCLTGEKCALVVSIRVVYYIIYQKLDKSLYHVIDFFFAHIFSEFTVLQNNWWKYLTWIERPSFVANLLFFPVNRLRHGLRLKQVAAQRRQGHYRENRGWSVLCVMGLWRQRNSQSTCLTTMLKRGVTAVGPGSLKNSFTISTAGTTSAALAISIPTAHWFSLHK